MLPQFPSLKGKLHFIVPGTTFRFSGISIFHIFTQCAQKGGFSQEKRVWKWGIRWNLCSLSTFVALQFPVFFLVAPLLCGFCLASGESDVKVTVTPASKSLASFSCSLYGNKCQTSVSPWQSAGEIDFLCRSNGSTL